MTDAKAARGPGFDALLFRAVAARLASELPGSRIQKVFEPTPGFLVLHHHPCPSGHPLLVRARGSGFVVPGEPGLENPAEPSAFCMQVRKHLEGAVVTGIEAPDLDRALVLRARGHEGVPTGLVVELLGTRTNLMVLGPDDRILGARKSYPTDRERFPERRWRPPPRRGPTAAERVGEGIPALAGHLAGLASARELGEFASGLSAAHCELVMAAREAGPEAAARLLAGLLDPEAWRRGPFLRTAWRGKSVVLVGAPEDALPEGAGTETHPDLWSLLAATFLRAAESERQDHSRREAEVAIRDGRNRIEDRLARNTEALAACGRIDELRAKGELLKRNLGTIPKGASQATLTDWSSGEAREVVIPLDPRRTAAQNMDRFFDKARRLRQKEPMLLRKRRHLEEDREELSRLEARLAEGEDPIRLKEELRALSLVEPGPDEDRQESAPKGRRSKEGGLRTFVSSDGLRILVGRNNRENDRLVRQVARKQDAWLHAEGVAGAHVVVKLAGRMERPPERTVVEAAQLAAHFSHLRYETKARVMLCRVGDLRKPANAPPGTVTIDRHETVVVRPDPGVVRRLAPPAG